LVRASNAPGHSPLSVELLRAVVEAGEIRASDLASALFVTKTSISRYVNEMLREGLLVQRRDPSDGRAALLSVSLEGRRELEEREARRSAWLRDLCRGWPKGDVATLTTLLQRLNDGVSRRLNDSAPR
jgi:DNA-binding MarR family transcriptional regulator